MNSIKWLNREVRDVSVVSNYPESYIHNRLLASDIQEVIPDKTKWRK